MQPIATYDISEARGFLSKFDADKIPLSGTFATARDAAMRLPQFLPSGRVRALLRDALPDVDMTEEIAAISDAEARLAMVHYSFMVQAWVWGEAKPSDRLPACLARPIVALSDRLGQPPLLPYSGYVLDNWAMFDPEGPISLDNTFMRQHFLGGQDETWFVLIHVAIEAQAGRVLVQMPDVVAAVETQDTARTRTHLEAMAECWTDINAIFDRMPERCDPYAYFERVRPYIHGWKDNPALPNGVVYAGTRFGEVGQVFRGQTGSQSSIVPAMDALMGVGHAADPMKAYLDELHIYRPPAHRRFIDDLRAESHLRDFVSRAGQRGLTEAYNANIQGVADFRSRHLEYAASYIHKQARHAAGNDTDVGTGGTPFMRYLKKHRDETAARLLPLASAAA